MLACARDFAGSIYARKFPCKFPVVYKGQFALPLVVLASERGRGPQSAPFNAADGQRLAAPSTAARVSSVAQPFLRFSAIEANFRKRSQRQNHSTNSV